MSTANSSRTKDRTGDLKGLACRRCGGRVFLVLYTRSAWGGRLLRRRECRHCGRRFTTAETAEE